MNIKKSFIIVATSIILSACGGGGDNSDEKQKELDEFLAPDNITGIAAVGAPIVNGWVQAKCANGDTASSTTGQDGSWSLKVDGQAFPCVIQVRAGTINGQAMEDALHSIAQSEGYVNVTPVTDLIVAEILNQSPTVWFDSDGAGNIAGVATTENVGAAIGIVNAAISTLPGNPTLPNGYNTMTSRFTPQPGDPMDDALENYAASLTAAGMSRSDAATAIATGNTSLTRESHTLRVYTNPGVSTFMAGYVQSIQNGEYSMIIPDANRGTRDMIVQQRDSSGNITQAASDEIVGFISELGNRVGQLCVGGQGEFHGAMKSQYVYVSDEMTVVTDISELKGKTFTEFEDCGQYGVTEYREDGTTVFTENGKPSDEPNNDGEQLFSPEGVTEDGSVVRAVAYKFTLNGVTKYVTVMTSTKIDPNDQNAEEFVAIGVSN